MRRGVVAGDRVLGQDAPRSAARTAGSPQPLVSPPKHAAVVDRLGEHVAEAGVLLGDQEQDQDDDRGADHVPPHRDVVDDGQQVAGEDVDDRREHQDDEEHDEHRWSGCSRRARLAERAEREVEERRAAVGHRGRMAIRPIRFSQPV